MEAVDKVVVTNAAALAAKYGDRAKEVIAAVDALVAADAERGIRATLVALDDAGAMGGLNVAPVTDPADPEQVKAACPGFLTRTT
jgi:hypothetical protein